jgi:hypothetical protein
MYAKEGNNNNNNNHEIFHFPFPLSYLFLSARSTIQPDIIVTKEYPVIELSLFLITGILRFTT